MSGVALDYLVPSADVAEYITLFYHFQANVPEFGDLERAAHAQLRFYLSDGEARYSFAESLATRPGRVHVIGPTTAPMTVWAKGPVHVFGCGLSPAGWSALIGSDASSAVNRSFDPPGILGQRMEVAWRALREAGTAAAMVAIGEAMVRELITHRCQEVLRFVREVDAWLAGSTSPEIEELVAATGRSRRQVERKCNALYGAPPKLLARKYRALRAAVAMRGGELSFDDAVGRGFYDQSHLIREVKNFTGLTPRQIRDEATPLSALTVDSRSAMAGQVNPIISGT